MSKIKAYMNWSGGKDSSLTLHKVLAEGRYEVTTLLTSVNKVHDRISMHGVRTELLRRQAEAIGIPLTMIELPEAPNMEEYEKEMENKVKSITAGGVHQAIFGDIFLEDLKIYRENKLRPMGIEAVFPIWKISTKDLMQQFLDLGFKSIIVCINNKFLDKSFCGRVIDQQFVNDLPAGVDVCGENGEFHSFVYDGPIFKKPVPFTKGEIVYREYSRPKTGSTHYNQQAAAVDEKNYGFYFCDLLPA